MVVQCGDLLTWGGTDARMHETRTLAYTVALNEGSRTQLTCTELNVGLVVLKKRSLACNKVALGTVSLKRSAR